MSLPESYPQVFHFSFYCLKESKQTTSPASESISSLPICISHISTPSDLSALCIFLTTLAAVSDNPFSFSAAPPHLPLHFFCDLFDFPLVVLSEELQLFVNKTQTFLSFLSHFQTINSEKKVSMAKPDKHISDLQTPGTPDKRHSPTQEPSVPISTVHYIHTAHRIKRMLLSQYFHIFPLHFKCSYSLIFLSKRKLVS